MDIEERVNELIEFITKRLRQTRGLDAKKVFLNGNCGNMYTIFSNYFVKESVVPYRITYKDEPYHIVSKIGEDFYDITGKTSIEQYIEYLTKHANNRKFNKDDFKIEEIPLPERWMTVRDQSNGYFEGYDEECEDEYTIGEEALSWARELKEEKLK